MSGLLMGLALGLTLVLIVVVSLENIKCAQEEEEDD